MKLGKAELRTTHSLGVSEASGLAPLDDATFLVVDDERGVFHCVPGSPPTSLQAGLGLSDLEGVGVSPDGRSAFVLAESDGSVWRYSIRGHDLIDGHRLGRLPHLSKRVNKGWEGIFVAAAGVFAPDAVMLAAHQAKPRRIGFFDADSLRQRSLLRLPEAARKGIGDLNGIAVTREGRILLLSGKRGRIAELLVESGELVLSGIYRIKTSTGDVPEGITVDAHDRIWVCTDGRGMLHRVTLVH